MFVRSLIKRCSIPTVKIEISESAFLKTAGLIEAFDGEVGWHGTVDKCENNVFKIDDVFVYPQVATAASIDTDQHEYEMWLMKQDENTFRRLRMHGHSHVNFSVCPSSKDDRHRLGLTAQLKPRMYYLFMIWNKRYDVHSYLHSGDGDILGPENVKVFVALARKRIPIDKLPVTELIRLLDCDMVKDFIMAARRVVSEGRGIA